MRPRVRSRRLRRSRRRDGTRVILVGCASRALGGSETSGLGCAGRCRALGIASIGSALDIWDLHVFMNRLWRGWAWMLALDGHGCFGAGFYVQSGAAAAHCFRPRRPIGQSDAFQSDPTQPASLPPKEEPCSRSKKTGYQVEALPPSSDRLLWWAARPRIGRQRKRNKENKLADRRPSIDKNDMVDLGGVDVVGVNQVVLADRVASYILSRL